MPSRDGAREQDPESAQVDIRYEIRRLRLFNDKVEKLRRSRFVAYVHEVGRSSIKLSAKRREAGDFEMTLEREGPDEEMIDAVVLTLRMFIQKNDPISLPKMAKVYDTLPVSQSLKERFHAERKAINDLLDSATHFSYNEANITNREIFYIFVYGELSHMEDAKRQVFEGWMQMPPFFAMILNEFCAVIYNLIGATFAIRAINLAAIEELEHLLAEPEAHSA